MIVKYYQNKLQFMVSFFILSSIFRYKYILSLLLLFKLSFSNLEILNTSFDHLQCILYVYYVDVKYKLPILILNITQIALNIEYLLVLYIIVFIVDQAGITFFPPSNLLLLLQCFFCCRYNMRFYKKLKLTGVLKCSSGIADVQRR